MKLVLNPGLESRIPEHALNVVDSVTKELVAGRFSPPGAPMDTPAAAPVPPTAVASPATVATPQ